MKRIFSIIIASLIVFFSLYVPTMALSFTELRLDEPMYVVPDEKEGVNFFSFVPDSTGYYCFYSEGVYDTFGAVFDSDITLIASNDDCQDYNFYVCCRLVGGKEYILATTLREQNGGEVYTVSAGRAGAAEEVVLFHGGETTGYVGTTLVFEALAEPEGAYLGECIWSTGDSSVATVYETQDNYAAIYFAGPGTTTVTVKSKELGVFDSFEVTSIEIPKIGADDSQYLYFGVMGGIRYFSFTPTVSGTYAAYTHYAYETSIIPYDSKWYECSYTEEMIPGTEDRMCKTYMEAGRTYYFEISTFGAEASDCEFVISPCQSAKSVYIYNEEDVYWGYEGEAIDLSVGMIPFYSFADSCTWVSSDPSVVKITDNSLGDGCTVSLLSQGEAYITATSSNGLSDSVRIVCERAESIALGEKKTVGAGVYSIPFRFVPEKDGYYAFVSEGSNASAGAVYDSKWNYINGSDMSFYADDDFSVKAYMNAGKEYYLEVVRNETKMTSPFKISVVESTESASVSFTSGGKAYGYVGDTIDLGIILDSNTSHVGSCKYSIGDKYIGEIVEESADGCTVSLLKAGETEITVKTENGLVATCDIVVSDMEYEKLSLGVATTVSVENYRYRYFSFTPKESGNYTFVSSGDVDTFCSLFDSNMYELKFDDDMGQGMNFSLSVDLIAGNTYIFGTGFYKANGANSFDVKLVKSVDADNVYIDSDRVIKATVGQMLYLTADFAPDGALAESVYWEAEGRDILGVMYEDKNMCGVYVMNEGIARLHVYSENGLSDSITVVCGAVMTLAGDVNSDEQVNAMDANVLRRHVAGAYDNVNLLTSDLNDDTVIDSRDSNLLKRLVAGR